MFGVAQAEAGVEVEVVEKDVDTLDEQAQRAAVAADAPELSALLGELRANLTEVRTRVGPLVKEVRTLHDLLLCSCCPSFGTILCTRCQMAPTMHLRVFPG